MKRFFCLALAFLTIQVASLVHAQMGPQPTPRIYGNFKPVVGGWSEYQIVAKGEPGQKMKIAVVGKEGNDYWYETVTEGKGTRVIYKVLVSGDPNDKKGAKRIIFKEGNNPAIELPAQPIGQEPKGKEEKAGKMIDKGMETVKVPAGIFKTRHFQYEGKEGVDVWLDEKVPPYGLVKSTAKEMEMVLLGYGTGAKSLITETPQKLNLPKMPRK
ncbi:MAG: DUF3108 domain-containing protein [Syntrophales bacterium]|nr:DUF3108 domain-containing protein [Syntrophales bacterium]